MFLPTAFEFVQQLHRHVRKIQRVMPTEKLVNMAMAFLTLSTGLVLVNGTTRGSELSFSYYNGLCPKFGALTTSKFQNITDAIVAAKVANDSGLPAALMRMCFHDCFVEGCDGSILLNSTADNVAERDAPLNLSLRGFEVIDAVKAALEVDCPGVFSCADIIQEVGLAAQRYVPNQPNPKANWLLRYGRRDVRVSLATRALQFLPLPIMNYSQLVANFAAKGLNKSDLVHLSGSHTFGVARCVSIFERLYNFSGIGDTDPALNASFATNLKALCPLESPLNVINLDVTTPNTFDNDYYTNIKIGKALLTSDDALKNDPIHVNANAASNALFVGINFALSFTKMTEINVTYYPNGEIRSNCSLRN